MKTRLQNQNQNQASVLNLHYVRLKKLSRCFWMARATRVQKKKREYAELHHCYNTSRQWNSLQLILEGRRNTDQRAQVTKGSLSKDVFERRTSTGSGPSSILICLVATKPVLLSVFTRIQTICPKIRESSLPKRGRRPLQVDLRRSKTSF